MKTIQEYICEHFVNIFRGDDISPYIDEIWDMLQAAYSKIGGTKGLESKEVLIKKTDLYKIVRKDGQILAVMCYSFKHGGRKGIYCATNGMPNGKEALYKILSEDKKMLDRMVWVECSGKVEGMLLSEKRGWAKIPATVAKQIMYDKTFVDYNPDGFHYTRNIGGYDVEKILLGNFADGDLEKLIKFNLDKKEAADFIKQQTELNKEIKNNLLK